MYKTYSKISKAIHTIAARKIRSVTYREFPGWIFQVRLIQRALHYRGRQRTRGLRGTHTETDSF